jgi:GYF domain 2
MGNDWYYARGGQRTGPCSLQELQGLASSGTIQPEDLVWKDGWTEWLPAAQVNGLGHLFGDGEVDDPSHDIPPPGTEGTDDAPSHFLDHLLDTLRGLYPDADFRGMASILIEFGRYGLYAAMVIGMVFSIIYAIKTNHLDAMFAGLGSVLIALALQYTAIRLSHAVTLLIRTTPTRMSSTAFLDSFSVVMMIGGMIALAACTLLSIRQENLNYFLEGIAAFFACEQLAFLSLHPAALNIKIVDDASSGEEAVGIISFFMMLPLRFVPGIFGIGTTVGAFGLLTCCFLYLKGGESVDTALLYGPVAACVVLTCAAFPLVIYIYFVLYYLVIDVIRSILVIPSKLDGLSEARQGPWVRPADHTIQGDAAA